MTSDSAGLLLLARRVANRIGRPFGINPFPRSFSNSLSDRSRKMSEVFDQIYQQNYWGSAQSRSGVGSEITFTKRYRLGLVSLMELRGFRRMFDAPCGDLNWMAQLIGETGIEYVGGDVSTQVIADARRRHPTLDLRVFNIVYDSFPEADVWHCRDCLFHLPLEAVREALANFAASRIPFALITSHHARFLHHNLDVDFGGFRYLDLNRPPISLPRPLARISDYRLGHDFPRYVCLWSRTQIADSLVRQGE